jgi:hypothetical protein
VSGPPIYYYLQEFFDRRNASAAIRDLDGADFRKMTMTVSWARADRSRRGGGGVDRSRSPVRLSPDSSRRGGGGENRSSVHRGTDRSRRGGEIRSSTTSRRSPTRLSNGARSRSRSQSPRRSPYRRPPGLHRRSSSSQSGSVLSVCVSRSHSPARISVNETPISAPCSPSREINSSSGGLAVEDPVVPTEAAEMDSANASQANGAAFSWLHLIYYLMTI